MTKCVRVFELTPGLLIYPIAGWDSEYLDNNGNLLRRQVFTSIFN